MSKKVKQQQLDGVGVLPPKYLSSSIKPTCYCTDGSEQLVRWCPEVMKACHLPTTEPTDESVVQLEKIISKEKKNNTTTPCFSSGSVTGYQLPSCENKTVFTNGQPQNQQTHVQQQTQPTCGRGSK